jgi:DNA polymerase I-like protein with 3'-5' exonuclease and polymerase domains
MGGGKLCQKLGLPTVRKLHTRSGESYLAAGPEGQALIDRFNHGVPFVGLLAKRVEANAKRYGVIRTAGGRKCRFPIKKGGGYDWTYKALNRLIQGSAGDQMKIAMVEMDKAGVPLQLQVHDEVDLTIHDRKEADEIVRIMRNALPCNVPAKVDVEIGPSWGEAS